MILIDATRAWDSRKTLLAAAWAIVFVCAVIAYLPGLEGPFLLDDLGSIKPLGDHGGVVDWESFKVFVFGGHAGPTGRPLSLLTFLVDANNWPADSLPFKRTNLIIHLINGVLLGILVSLILKCVQARGRGNQLITLVVTAIWLLHPFLVSTTLYIVQRMAQLSTLFMFAGLAAWLHARMLMTTDADHRQTRRAYLVMTGAVGLFTLLAMISKENGILLPVLILAAELTIVASQQERLTTLNRYWVVIFLVLPLVVITLYLGERITRDNFFEIVPPRDFSIYERFLTQGRILVDYMQHWFLPKLYKTGVFQDHFIKSTSWFQPVSTIVAWLFHIGLIVFAFMKRRTLPLSSLAILFFYANHLLESTVINLELYFEHRNYISAALLFLPLVEFAHRKLDLRMFLIASIAAVVLVGSFTRYSATVWRSLPSMIESSALKAPTSARAQGQWAKLLFVAGRKDEALAVIERAIDTIPADDPLLLTSKLYFQCNMNKLSPDEFSQTGARVSATPFDSRALQAYNVFAQEVVTGKCPAIGAGMVERVFLDMLDVPANNDPTSLAYSHVQYLIGYTRVYDQRPQEALEVFQKSLDARPGASHAMAMAALLASNNFGEQALVLAERALGQLQKDRADPTKVVKVRESDILAFQERVRHDLAAQGGSNPGATE